MANMSYCRHENTLADLRDVFEQWYDFDESKANEREIRARQRLKDLIHEMDQDINEEKFNALVEAWS